VTLKKCRPDVRIGRPKHSTATAVSIQMRRQTIAGDGCRLRTWARAIIWLPPWPVLEISTSSYPRVYRVQQQYLTDAARLKKCTSTVQSYSCTVVADACLPACLHACRGGCKYLGGQYSRQYVGLSSEYSRRKWIYDLLLLAKADSQKRRSSHERTFPAASGHRNLKAAAAKRLAGTDDGAELPLDPRIAAGGSTPHSVLCPGKER
jgi:hypothetical protein